MCLLHLLPVESLAMPRTLAATLAIPSTSSPPISSWVSISDFHLLLGSSKVRCIDAVEKVPHLFGLQGWLIESRHFWEAFHMAFCKQFEDQASSFTFIKLVF